MEAHRFAGHLRTRTDVLRRISHLDEVLQFEHPLVRATLFKTSTEVRWTADPSAIFDALDSGRIASALPAVSSTMRISADADVG